MGNDFFALIIAAIVLLLMIIVFIRISIRLRKSGGSLNTAMTAATYEFLNKDRREAAEEIVEMQANKKMEEEFSGDELKESG